MENQDKELSQGYWLLLPLIAGLFLVLCFLAYTGFRDDDPVPAETDRGRLVEGVVTSVQNAGQGATSIEVMNSKGAKVEVGTPSSETAAKLDCIKLPTVEEMGAASVRFFLPLSDEALTSEPSAETYNTCWPKDEAGQEYYFKITADRNSNSE